jgi:GT2 family glycosyltransferase
MQQPTFSIIVPTHGRDAALRRCLEALAALDYPPERYEVIVVYDGGRPSSLPEADGRRVRFLTQPKRGPAAARNLGASQAGGSYLAFTDDDCVPAADWLLWLAAVLERFPTGMAGGRVVNALPGNRYAAAGQLMVDYLYERFNNDPLKARFFTANNMAVRRDLFLALGGFDGRFPLAAGEDRDFCGRWLEAGHPMVYEPAAVVRHAHPLTLARFWQQQVNYGRGAYHFRRQQAQQSGRPLRLESPSFYARLLAFPLRSAELPRALYLFLLFVLMQAANTAGFLQERAARRQSLSPD